MSMRGKSSVEILERRAYAAAGTPVVKLDAGGNPSAVVRELSPGQTPAVEPVAVSVGPDRAVYVHGTFGDDSVRVRGVGGGLEVRTYTRQTFAFAAASGHGATHVDTQTATIESVFRFAPGEFAGLGVQTAAGSDSLRVTPLPFTVSTDSVEATAAMTYPDAPAGQTPSDPLSGGHSGTGWATIVAAHQTLADLSTADVAFFGDSHAARFPEIAPAEWQTRFAAAADFGIGGDGTRQLLARIEAGLFDVYQPKTLIVSVGTNNLNRPALDGSDDQVFAGITAVADALRARLPDTRLVLLGLLPRVGAGLNARSLALNARLSATSATGRFDFVDVYARIAAVPANHPTPLITDDSHFTAAGYAVLGEALGQLLDAVPNT